MFAARGDLSFTLGKVLEVAVFRKLISLTFEFLSCNPHTPGILDSAIF